MQLADHPSRRHLAAALDELARTFRGMTAHPDEHNCECHWGSPDELRLLKTPDAELDPDLLRRTWQAADWSHQAAVLRRILPQFARTLVSGEADAVFGPADWARAFRNSGWRKWPADHSGPVWEFLHAWWVSSLTDPETAVPAHEVFVLCAEASHTVTPWLADWAGERGPLSDRRLAEAVAEWEYDLLGDDLPWQAWEYGTEMREELSAWLTDHAAPRLRASGAPAGLLNGIRLLGLTDEDRWTDPQWPGYRY
ncbi:hypothetical protein [Streptomyces wuyuanensis]|uniref:Uncharacterized protein n=1 Tax=Streptomyces wuyuanensis TaxID=1196353 RepID=A0A1H0E090_9ACTN|nr:hypothetical protein [Streptomyces wuyuanensis]SDN75779.1 hypothetical protein SAMN05444921_13818 [Streptomyces wuyuanensis]